MHRLTAVQIALIPILVIGLLAPVATFAQSATPGPANLTDATAPFGLGSVSLPTDEAAILALFELLPDVIAGKPETKPVTLVFDRIVISYGQDDPGFGPPLSLQAVNLGGGDFFPADFTVGDYVTMAAATSDNGATSAGRDGDLLWIRAETTAGIEGEKPGTPAITQPLYTLAWGTGESQWLFTAVATAPETLDALVTAFVIAAGGQPATPAADGTPIPYSRQDGCPARP